MTVTLTTRKPADQLRLSDFSAYPVWAFTLNEEAVEGRDESWVRPLGTQGVPQHDYTLVSAVYRDSRNRKFAGYVVASTLDEVLEIRPGAIFDGNRLIRVPGPSESGYRESRSALMGDLGLAEAEVTSLSFTLNVPVEGKPWFIDGEFRFPPPPQTCEHQLELW